MEITSCCQRCIFPFMLRCFHLLDLFELICVCCSFSILLDKHGNTVTISNTKICSNNILGYYYSTTLIVPFILLLTMPNSQRIRILGQTCSSKVKLSFRDCNLTLHCYNSVPCLLSTAECTGGEKNTIQATKMQMSNMVDCIWV